MQNILLKPVTTTLPNTSTQYKEYAKNAISSALQYVSENNEKLPLPLAYNSVIFFVEDPSIGVAIAKQLKEYKDTGVKPWSYLKQVYVQHEECNFSVGENKDILDLYQSDSEFFPEYVNLNNTLIYEEGIIILGRSYIGCTYKNPQSHTLFVVCKSLIKDKGVLDYCYSQKEIHRADNTFCKNTTSSMLTLIPSS